ncbi:MAG TPA: hypothetical protein VGD56_18435 [Gemmatirosa sp.]
MSSPPATSTAEARAAQARQLRPVYWILLVMAVVDLGLFVWHSPRFPSRQRPYGWVLPAGLLCMAVGGLTGVRHPVMHRWLIGGALVLAGGAVVVAVRG